MQMKREMNCRLNKDTSKQIHAIYVVLLCRKKESVTEEEISSLCYVAVERDIKLHSLFVQEINFSIIRTLTTNCTAT